MPIVEAQPLHTPPLQRSSKVCSVPLKYGFVIENDNTTHILENDGPMTYSEAIMSSDSNKLLNVMKSKMDSMYANQVWTLVDASVGETPVGCKWVFKRKIEVDG